MLPRNKVTAVIEAPVIQWASGKNEVRSTPGAGRYVAGHVGFYSEVGKDEEFDAWLAGLNCPKLQMRHPRQGGPAAEVLHWNLGEHLRLFPLTAGPVAPTVAASLKPGNHAATIEAGIGLRWTRGDGERSKLAIRGYLSLEGDIYPMPVQLTTRSRMTDALLSALIDHVRVCELADSAIDRTKHPDVIGLWELALPLGPGEESAWGRGETTTVVPLQSTHAERPDLPYLRSLWRPNDLAAWVERDWPAVQSWAREFSLSGQMQEEYTA